MIPETEASFQKAPIGYQLKIVNTQYRIMVDAMLKEEDVTMAQFSVLLYLIKETDGRRRATQKEICEALHVKHPTMNGLLTRMEEKDLIHQEFNPDNRRQRIITVTDKALTLMQRHKQIHDRIDSMMFRDFSEEEMRSFSKFLYKVYANLTESGAISPAEMSESPCSNIISPEDLHA